MVGSPRVVVVVLGFVSLLQCSDKYKDINKKFHNKWSYRLDEPIRIENRKKIMIPTMMLLNDKKQINIIIHD